MAIRTPFLAQLYACAIVPALRALDLDSPAARSLVLGTAAHESMGGRYLSQYPSGPAQGVFQIQPATELDTLARVRQRDMMLASSVMSMRTDWGGSPQLVVNLLYGAAICRLIYWLVDESLPDAGDVFAQGEYWKRYYNTPDGKGAAALFVDDYERYIGSPADLESV